jgi:hypothetical protein
VAIKRNRQERRAADIYKMTSYFQDSPDGPLRVAEVDHYIEGFIGDYLIISVPETTSINAMERIKAQLQAKLECPILVCSHNMEFMKVQKLTPQEAARVIKRAESDVKA